MLNIDSYVLSPFCICRGVARVTGTRGQAKILPPPPTQKNISFHLNDNIMSSIAHVYNPISVYMHIQLLL